MSVKQKAGHRSPKKMNNQIRNAQVQEARRMNCIRGPAASNSQPIMNPCALRPSVSPMPPDQQHCESNVSASPKRRRSSTFVLVSTAVRSGSLYERTLWSLPLPFLDVYPSQMTGSSVTAGEDEIDEHFFWRDECYRAFPKFPKSHLDLHVRLVVWCRACQLAMA